jgi:outer membrane protein OmpA-like peptidoglycan-associated protein
MRLAAFSLLLTSPLLLLAQETNPTQSNVQPGNGGSVPIFKVEVVSRTIPAISYRHRSGWTKIDFQGTQLAQKAHGTAEVNSGLGHAQIKLDVKDLPAPQSFGNEFLTYVLWAITPDGHAANISEIVLDSSGKYHSDSISTDLQAFGLIITAEPYYDVAMPSDVVVMENVARTDTLGKQEVVDAKFELLPRGQYLYHVPTSAQHPIDLNSGNKNPLDIYEAMNAINIAQYAKADQFATDQFQAAQTLLTQAEDYAARKQWKPSIMTAKEAVQKAEDARIVSLRRQEQQAQEQARKEAADRIAAARAQAAAEQQAAAEAAERQKLAEQQAQTEAQARAQADQARAQADQARAEADAARAQAAAEAQRANAAAEEANRLRAQAVADKEALRQQLLQQFNAILQTTLTTRGLIINMSDVLFDFNKYSLKEPTREKLARLSGIILSHPGLNLKVEGYTDSVGTDEYNQKLSEQRADTVREFLVTQGITADTISAMGYGKQYPVASNDTASGRAMNRRVDIVVSGEIIGIQIGVPPSQGQQPMQAPQGAPAPMTVPQPQR